MKTKFEEICRLAAAQHDKCGCTYGEDKKEYRVHTDDVAKKVEEYRDVFLYSDDYHTTHYAAACHDLIEDAQFNYSDIVRISNRDCADVVLAVSDVPAENRLLRHLQTFPKILKDHRALILKMCDLLSNCGYGEDNGGSMHKKYQKEYSGYKRYLILQGYHVNEGFYNKRAFMELLMELDEVHNYCVG